MSCTPWETVTEEMYGMPADARSLSPLSSVGFRQPETVLQPWLPSPPPEEPTIEAVLGVEPPTETALDLLKAQSKLRVLECTIRELLAQIDALKEALVNADPYQCVIHYRVELHPDELLYVQVDDMDSGLDHETAALVDTLIDTQVAKELISSLLKEKKELEARLKQVPSA
jgi:hypothetical protein